MSRAWLLLGLGLLAAPARLGLLAAPAAAQEALYGPQPPPGSAYVRFVNATAVQVELRPDFLPPRTLGIAGADRVDPYEAVEAVAGRAFGLALRAGGHDARATLSVPPDSFDTVLVRTDPLGQPSALVIVEDAAFDQARARLSFYNATSACADGALTLLPNGPAVFAGLAPGTVRSRGVNPVQAKLRATCAGLAADLSLDGMAAGGSTSVWLMQPGGQALALVTQDAVQPYAP